MLFAFFFFLLATWYFPFGTCYLLLANYFLLLDTCYLLLCICYLLHATRYLLLAICYLQAEPTSWDHSTWSRRWLHRWSCHGKGCISSSFDMKFQGCRIIPHSINYIIHKEMTYMGEISQGVQSLNLVSYFLYFLAPFLATYKLAMPKIATFSENIWAPHGLHVSVRTISTFYIALFSEYATEYSFSLNNAI